MSDETRLVVLSMCHACLRGEGGECHTPGCVMWLKRAPDLSLAGLYEDVTEEAARLPESVKPSLARIAELTGALELANRLLTRACKYAVEDRASTPGSTRLARLILEARRYLGELPTPPDLARPTSRKDDRK